MRITAGVCRMALACGASALVACDTGTDERTEPSPPPAANAWDPGAWTPPSITEAPADSLGASIRRGLALFVHTRDSLPRFVGGNMNCSSCHLDEGRRPTAAPLTGVFARFPKYMDRTGAVIPLEDRVNYCFTRSLSGTRLPVGSREMQDIMAYLAFLSQGVPMGAHVKSEGMPKMPSGFIGDSARGHAVFTANCIRCHGPDGQGLAAVPALWGPKSFSIGASMAREERAATFIRHNMPFDMPGTLSDQDAFDLAAFVVSHPRPDSPGKESDWPLGGTPADVPYNTVDHKAYKPPPTLTRRDPAGAIVPPPARVAERSSR